MVSQQLSSAYLSRNEEGPYLLVKSWMGKSKYTSEQFVVWVRLLLLPLRLQLHGKAIVSRG